jgi:hypothetical protein
MKEKKDELASSDDTVITGGGYVGARTTQMKKISVGQRGCVSWHPDPYLAK